MKTLHLAVIIPGQENPFHQYNQYPFLDPKFIPKKTKLNKPLLHINQLTIQSHNPFGNLILVDELIVFENWGKWAGKLGIFKFS